MTPQTAPEGALSDFIEQTRHIYTDMDADYKRSADACGFVCKGCDDNCCRTLFYHHTFTEYITVRAGFALLAKEQRQRVLARASEYLRVIAAESGANPQRPICPLNESGLCILYAERPMICRLHGIEHAFTPPGHQQQRLGPGCADFYRQCGSAAQLRLDRTPHYLKLARLESRLKKEFGLNRKLKLTIADMLLNRPFEFREAHSTLLTPQPPMDE